MPGEEHARLLSGEVIGSITTGSAAQATGAGDSSSTRRLRPITAAEIAWIGLIPCGVAIVVAAIVLGPPLGRALVRPDADGLWPATWWPAQGLPKQVEYGRYAIMVLAPFLLSAAVLLGSRRPLRMPATVVRPIVLVSQLLVWAVVGAAILGQRNVVLVDDSWTLPPVFSLRTLAVSGILAIVVAVLLRRDQIAERLGWLARETPTRRVACLVIACVFAAALMLDAVTTDRLSEDNGTMNWTLNDAFAVLNGRTPLVDYHVIYGKLVPYVAAAAMAAFGTTTLVYTLVMMVLSAAAFVAVYAVFRRLVRSSLVALAAFVPFAAMSGVGHATIMPSVWPMRYAGAYLLAWMTARHLDGARPRRAWPLFFAGGFVVINNMEFGLGALAASLAALLCAALPRTRRDAARLAAEALGGLLAAAVLIAGVTLVRTGGLPSVEVLLEWPRLFTNLGWFALPMPSAGLHLAIYVTFVAAIVVAAVRIARSADDALLTSMLVWAGVFGMAAGMYYVGRSDDTRLLSMFSAWAFAITLLTIVAVKALAGRRRRRLEPASLVVLFGFSLMVCSTTQLTLPQDHVTRLTENVPPPEYRASAKRFVRARTAPGETVVMLIPMGYRVAHELGITNVAPYGIQNAAVTRGQVQNVIDAAREAGVARIFVPAPGSRIAGEGDTAPEQLLMYGAAGFPIASSTTEFVELRRAATP